MHAVSYQNITTQRILLEKRQIGSSVKDGVVKACSRFYACFFHCFSSQQNYIEKLGSYQRESTFFG